MENAFQLLKPFLYILSLLGAPVEVKPQNKCLNALFRIAICISFTVNTFLFVLSVVGMVVFMLWYIVAHNITLLNGGHKLISYETWVGSFFLLNAMYVRNIWLRKNKCFELITKLKMIKFNGHVKCNSDSVVCTLVSFYTAAFFDFIFGCWCLVDILEEPHADKIAVYILLILCFSPMLYSAFYFSVFSHFLISACKTISLELELHENEIKVTKSALRLAKSFQKSTEKFLQLKQLAQTVNKAFSMAPFCGFLVTKLPVSLLI
jgi:hypothetical protein